MTDPKPREVLERVMEAVYNGTLEGRCDCDLRRDDGRFTRHEFHCGRKAVAEVADLRKHYTCEVSDDDQD